MTEELKNWFNAKVEDIIARVKSDNDKAEAKSYEVTLADNDEIVAKLGDFEAKVGELTESIAELEGEKATLSEEVTRLNALLSKAEAKGTEVETDKDPNVREDKVVDANAEAFNALANMIKGNI